MTDQHRATPEQWAYMAELEEDPTCDPHASCLLELRARVEALEKAQVDGIQRGPVMPPDSLALRMAWLLAAAFSKSRPGDDLLPTARAAIREVAAWLNKRDSSIQNQSPDHYDVPTADDAIRWLREEANR